MRQRLISAAVLVPVVVIVFVAGQPWLTLGIAALAAIAAYEAAQLVRAAGLPASPRLAVIWTPLTVIAYTLAVELGDRSNFWIILVPGIAALVIVAAIPAMSQPDPRTGLLSWIGSMFAALYPSLLAFAAAFAGFYPGPQRESLFGYRLETGHLWLVVLVATVWALDSAAYLAGRYHGRGRFMQHISPNKTWSGVVGGTTVAILTSAALVGASTGNPLAGGVIGLLIAIAAQAGDLAESLLKRAARVKDSGTLIPGHGGFLDRVDSFLFAAPVLYFAVAVLFPFLSEIPW